MFQHGNADKNVILPQKLHKIETTERNLNKLLLFEFYGQRNVIEFS